MAEQKKRARNTKTSVRYLHTVVGRGYKPNMQCEACKAEFLVQPSRAFKFCPMCGREVEHPKVEFIDKLTFGSFG